MTHLKMWKEVVVC